MITSSEVEKKKRTKAQATGHRRTHRPPLRPKTGDLKTSRAVCRRSDLFVDGPEAPEGGYDIHYASGRQEGSVVLLAVQNIGLNTHALALLVVLCDLYVQKKYRIIHNQETGTIRRAITTTPKQLVEAIYGHKGQSSKPSKTYYEVLGLARHSNSLGALDALASVLIKKDSHWLAADGKVHRVVEAFHLIDGYRYRQIGRKEYLQVFLSDALQAELKDLEEQGQWTLVPQAIVQRLGPKKQQALRVALHVLSHAPFSASHTQGITAPHREIGVTALVNIIRPDTHRNPQRYPGRFQGMVQRIVSTINAADPNHTWYVTSATSDPLGKVVCLDNPRKQGH